MTGPEDEVGQEITRTVGDRTLLDAFAETTSRHGDVPALKWRSGAGWAALTWRELADRVEWATLGLLGLGVRPGEPVGVLLSNRPELAVADLALLHARAVPVFLFDSFTDEQIATVLRTLGIELVIVEGRAELGRLRGAARAVVVSGEVPGVASWESVMAAGRARAARSDGEFAALRRAARPDDVVAVNYTSGTTGALKGVRHTHRNIMWHAESFARFMPMPPGARYLSYLPRAHATERFLTTLYPLTRAGTVYLCRDPAGLAEHLVAVRPHFFGGVLRVWEKLYAAAVPAPVGAGPVPGATAIQHPGSGVPRPAPNALAAARLGLDECRFAFSGGGALAEAVQEFFNGIGVPLGEGWGQSELVSAATCGRAGEIRIGTAGRPLPGVAVRTAADGELLVRSGSRMLGYAGAAAEASAVDAEGWLHTGDLGRIDVDGYVRLDGRRQEVFRLASGHTVSPTRVESQLRANPLVEQAYVFGAGDPELCAILVVPDGTERIGELADIVRDGNQRLVPGDRIARFAVVDDRWLPGRAEELTHTGKLKRSLIATKYADLVESLRHRGGVDRHQPLG